jgi:hypothetical protein
MTSHASTTLVKHETGVPSTIKVQIRSGLGLIGGGGNVVMY